MPSLPPRENLFTKLSQVAPHPSIPFSQEVSRLANKYPNLLFASIDVDKHKDIAKGYGFKPLDVDVGDMNRMAKGYGSGYLRTFFVVENGKWMKVVGADEVLLRLAVLKLDEI